jgi:hypothetical protein
MNMPMYVWIKVTPDGQPTKITCEPDDDIDILKRNIKEQLSPKFDQVARDEIIVRDANNVIIHPGVEISSYGQSLGSSSKLPFLVDSPAVQATGKCTFKHIFIANRIEYLYCIY